MSVNPGTDSDPDGVDRDSPADEVHENVRHTTEGVESEAQKDDEPASLIGNGMAVDPRLTHGNA